MWRAICAIALGSALGGLLRWGLALRLNVLLPKIPPGTLIANLVAGYIIGLAISFFANSPSVATEWRLLIMTGFCGGLSTFSTFSAEVVTLLQRGELTWALIAISIHVVGSLIMTLAGIASYHLLRFH